MEHGALKTLAAKRLLESIDEPLDRAIIILTIKWGFTPEEIGEVFGISTPHLLVEKLLKKASKYPI